MGSARKARFLRAMSISHSAVRNGLVDSLLQHNAFFIIFFNTMYNKTIIRFGFCDFRNNQSRGKCYQPKPKTLTSILIIPDITKPSSNNCLITCSTEGEVRVIGRRIIRWLRENHIPSIIAKFRQHVNTAFYIRYSYTYVLVKIIENGLKMLYYKQQKGSPWINHFFSGRQMVE